MDNWNTRESLLLRASDPDDHEAFEEFVYYYKNFISMVFVKMGVNDSHVDDLKQDLLVKLWRDISKFDSTRENSNFRGWLSVVIRHEVYRFFRKSKKNQTDELPDNHLNLSEESEVDKMIEDEWKAYVTSLAVEKVKSYFDGNALKVFYLTLEGKNAAAIAEELDMSENSVYVLRSRVKARFQSEIRQLRMFLENHQ